MPGVQYLKPANGEYASAEIRTLLEKHSPDRTPDEMFVLEGNTERAYCLLFNGCNGNGSRYHASAQGQGIFLCENSQGTLKSVYFPVFEDPFRQLPLFPGTVIDQLIENAKRYGDPFSNGLHLPTKE